MLRESVIYLNDDFINNIKADSSDFISKIKNCNKEELILTTPQYLKPYLEYVFNNKKLFSTVLNNSVTLGLEKSYKAMFKHVFSYII